MIALDFETFYTGTYSVKKLGNRLYCRDPRYQILMVAVHSPTLTLARIPRDFDWALLHNEEIVAHNAAFDRAVFERAVELGICPPDIKPDTWHDSAALCAYLGLPRDLAGAVKALWGIDVDKSLRTRMDQGDLFDDVASYAASDAEWAWRIWDMLSSKWPESERQLLAFTDAMGDRGVAIDRLKAQTAHVELRGIIASSEALLPFRPVASSKAFKAACETEGEPVPPSTAVSPAVDAWCSKHQKRKSPLWVRYLQQWRKANRTLKVVEAMLNRISPDTGRMQYQLKYFGAVQTGRWSGGGGLNLQNLNRTGANGVDLRGLIVPEPGHLFVIADYAQIEARVLHWLAGDYEFLDALRDGTDMYEVAARRMLGYDHPDPIKTRNPGLRQLAKAMTLGLGFGMGARQFVTAAKTLAGLDLEEGVCQQHVRTYRVRNPLITALWGRLAAAFRKRSGKPYYGLRLPSGRLLRYWRPEAAFDGPLTAEQVKGGPRMLIHPGLLAENLVQATARDLLGLAWLRCAKAGYPPVMSIHDELVFEVPANEVEQAKEHITYLMSEKPPWDYSDRLPLLVEATVAERYGK